MASDNHPLVAVTTYFTAAEYEKLLRRQRALMAHGYSQGVIRGHMGLQEVPRGWNGNNSENYISEGTHLFRLGSQQD